MSSCLISKVYELWVERVLVFECRSECRGWIWLKRIIYWKSIKLWLHNLERYFNLWPFYCHRWWTQLSLSCTWWGTLWDCKSGRSPSQKSWCLTSLESDSKINSLTKWTFKSKINRKKTNNKDGEMLPESSPAPADLWEGYLRLHQRCQTQRFYSFPILQQYMAFSPAESVISPPWGLTRTLPVTPVCEAAEAWGWRRWLLTASSLFHLFLWALTCSSSVR